MTKTDKKLEQLYGEYCRSDYNRRRTDMLLGPHQAKDHADFRFFIITLACAVVVFVAGCYLIPEAWKAIAQRLPH